MQLCVSGSLRSNAAEGFVVPYRAEDRSVAESVRGCEKLREQIFTNQKRFSVTPASTTYPANRDRPLSGSPAFRRMRRRRVSPPVGMGVSFTYCFVMVGTEPGLRNVITSASACGDESGGRATI